MDSGTFRIPGPAWKHRFDEPLDAPGAPSRMMSVWAMLKMLPMIMRMMGYVKKRKESGFDPINFQPPVFPGPYHGVPLGGIGAGSINRGWRGEFRRWQLKPGSIYNAPIYADQFSLFTQPAGQPASAQVLFPGHPQDGSLSKWQWDLPAGQAEYAALFPRAWTVYTDPRSGLRLTCRQLSPVIGRNYRETSFPACEFRWRIENTGALPVKTGLMFTFQNSLGGPSDAAGGHANRPFEYEGIKGIELRHAYRQQQVLDPDLSREKSVSRQSFTDPLAFAISGRGVGAGVTYRARFDAGGDGAEVWADFATDGRLENAADDRPAAPGEKIGAALAVTLELAPGEIREVAFSLAWDMPIARMGFGTPYHRRYTCFYGAAGDCAPQMSVDTLLHADAWEAQIEAWQSPILNNADLPDWYRGALFNELYYLVDGNTCWCAPLNGWPSQAGVGRFAYLESHEYRFYNTYDVHFYSSFALLMNWPEIELAFQRDIAAATLAQYPDQMTEIYTGKRVPRKLAGAVPHDIGSPDEDPWDKVNAYWMHDVNDWKDLNPKFVLQVYRDYLATGDLRFALDTWEAVDAAIRRTHRFDRDGDGLIENDGFPDQTYDVWPVKGASAYTGGLWLASLAAAVQLAEVAHEPLLAAEYRKMLARGKKAYTARLWNGRYFNYDSSRSPQHDSIMADQLAGQWYARACGLEPIVEPEQACSALCTIYDFNVQQFMGGQMGAVNGMRPDGQPDRTCLQSQEVWTGSTYALAAAMLQEGMHGAAFATAHGVYRTTYEGSGYWFQTPEAWDREGNYRAIAYMRPLAIWSMQWAIEHASGRKVEC